VPEARRGAEGGDVARQLPVGLRPLLELGEQDRRVRTSSRSVVPADLVD
jgi:hypothetical protein